MKLAAQSDLASTPLRLTPFITLNAVDMSSCMLISMYLAFFPLHGCYMKSDNNKDTAMGTVKLSVPLELIASMVVASNAIRVE
jgi:hypothetical protein